MKKTLALIFMLVLVAFAFASCGKGGNSDATTAPTAAGTTATPTEPEATEPGPTSTSHEHTPDPAGWIIESEPTCVTPGSKVLFCEECGLEMQREEIPIDLNKHRVTEWSAEPTLLNPTVHRTGECVLCQQMQEEDATFRHNVQVFTDSSGKYTAGSATLGEIRGDEHFYPTDEHPSGNDLLVEYSILWNETLPNNLYSSNSTMPAVDLRFTLNKGGTSENLGLVRLELTSDCPSQWAFCKFAGGFTASGTPESGHPYPRFVGTVADVTAYPNLGGANLGDGQPIGEIQWGWHRVQIRVREEVTNLNAVKTTGADATYFIQIWVYVDGVLVSHTSQPEVTKAEKYDRQFFTVASDGEGGVVYTENDALYVHGAFLDSKRMKLDQKGYYEIADYSVTIGSDFVQNIRKVTVPDPDTLEVEEGVTVPSTMWYVAVHDHVPAADYTVDLEPTCADPGSKSKHCTICREIIADTVVEIEPIASGGHTPAADYTVDVEPTCTALGSRSKHCTVCHNIIPETVEPIDMIAHVAKADYTIDVAATCSTEGSKSKHCAVCDIIITDTVTSIPTEADAHVVADWAFTVQPTLLADGTKTGTCTLCSSPVVSVASYEPDVQIFTEAKGKYTPNYATLGEIRGTEHFYDEGNDLLVEYSILWNETLPNNLYKSSSTMPAIDLRLAQDTTGTKNNSGLVRWELADDIPSEWVGCNFAGGFTAAGTPESDHPYSRFKENDKDITAYPNIGGANLGDGQPVGDTQWGWHRVSIRIREEVTNLDAVKTGEEATYFIQIWIYIDGVFVSHTSTTELTKKAKYDRQFFTVESDGEGGVAYTENDALYLHGAFLDSKRMKTGEKGYYAIADYSATIGSDFVQNVKKETNPDLDATLEVETGVFVPATMWYTSVSE